MYKEVLPDLPAADLLLTDPPYLVRARAGAGAFGHRKSLVLTGGFTDEGLDYSFLSGHSNWFCFCSRLQLPGLLAVVQKRTRWNLITWAKPNPLPTCNNKYLPDVEYIVHGFDPGRLHGGMAHKQSFILHPCGNKKTPHPNEKPTLVIRKLLVLGTKPGEAVLDPFMGSGTTLLVAKNMSRRAIGIEIEERYCEIAAKRLEQEVFDFGEDAA